MQRSPVPIFGKRHATTPMATPPASDDAAFFAEARREIAADATRPRVVPVSVRAAVLASIVVGCFLLSLDIQGASTVNPNLTPLLEMEGLKGVAAQAMPYMILLSLLGGVRIAAATLLIAHRVLAFAGQTSPLAYALGGAALTAAYAGILMALTHQPPTHGWLVDLAAGAGSGFFYRLFAGARPPDGGA
jgi:hypothetical protein